MTDMTLTALKKDLVDSLTESAELVDNQIDHLLSVAAVELARVKRFTLCGHVMLQPGISVYNAPADMIAYKVHIWGRYQRQMYNLWDPRYPRTLPTVTVTQGRPKQIHLSFAPGSHLISLLGSQFSFYYYASHTLSDTPGETTVPVFERDLLLLRAQAEAMKVLSIRYADSTVSSKLMISGATKIGTPAALYKTFLSEFERRAAC
ncbi:hypothetical protein NX722_13655 [Endozoicomonas gorgoniicola]|uniref:Uncharacterized protein n=1 Tax=Endozoicomonas gorgoniicola TaxID=1234144 RepID=A0ABT3MW95_9GAMM|nr:hypothetical protein [Endozoicomonas gorgoniicola]MCW7553654.1 hypothetical protein [Endozoicomonas gorgoniicola]